MKRIVTDSATALAGTDTRTRPSGDRNSAAPPGTTRISDVSVTTAVPVTSAVGVMSTVVVAVGVTVEVDDAVAVTVGVTVAVVVSDGVEVTVALELGTGVRVEVSRMGASRCGVGLISAGEATAVTLARGLPVGAVSLGVTVACTVAVVTAAVALGVTVTSAVPVATGTVGVALWAQAIRVLGPTSPMPKPATTSQRLTRPTPRSVPRLCVKTRSSIVVRGKPHNETNRKPQKRLI